MVVTGSADVGNSFLAPTTAGGPVLGGMLTNADGSMAQSPQMVHVIVPRGDYEIIDGSWDVVGLRGTGSKDLVIEGCDVPEYRVIPGTASSAARNRHDPGAQRRSTSCRGRACSLRAARTELLANADYFWDFAERGEAATFERRAQDWRPRCARRSAR